MYACAPQNRDPVLLTLCSPRVSGHEMINNKPPSCCTQRECLTEQHKKEHGVGDCYAVGKDLVTIATCFRSCPFHAKNQVGPVSPPTATPQGERSHSGATAGKPHKGHMKESKPPSAAYHMGLGSSRTGMSATTGEEWISSSCKRNENSL